MIASLRGGFVSFALLVPSAWSQMTAPVLISDIETAPPTNVPISSFPRVVGTLGSDVLIHLSVSPSNAGMWRYTPGAPSAVRLSQYEPGYVGPVVELPNGVAVYTTTALGAVPWRTDGTAAGTFPIEALSGGNPITVNAGPIEWGGRAYFLGGAPAIQSEVWSTDGSIAGTTLDYDLTPGNDVAASSDLFVAGGKLYVSIFTASKDSKLYVIPSPGAQPILLITTTLPNSLYDAIEFQGDLWFTWADAVAGRELWRSDGTALGTNRVIDIDPGSGDSGIRFIAADASRLWFRAWQSSTGYELWATDGTTTALVKDVNPGTGDGCFYARGDVTAGGKLVFAGVGSSGVLHPYVSDGSATGTQAIGSITALTDSFESMGGHVYFMGTTGQSSYQLYRTDGTSVGTKIIVTGPNSFGQPFVAGSTLWFQNYDAANGYELWSSNGTSLGTSLAVELVPELLTKSSSPGDFLRVGSELYFAATSGAFGRELWATDGTTAGTRRVADIVSGQWSSSPVMGAALGNLMVFAAADTTMGLEPWVTNGTSGGTFRLADIAPGIAYSTPIGFRTLGSVVLFAAAPDQINKRLYRSDGTAAGTYVISPPGMTIDGDAVGRSAILDGKIFFSAYFAGEGAELWVSDGTATGTKRVIEIAHGADSSFPTDLVRLGDFVYFSARNTALGDELYRSDGTAAGTTLVNDIAAGGLWSGPAGKTVLGDRLIFSANDWTNGSELWVSDGSTVGTQLLADLVPGTGNLGSQPQILGRVGDRVYFIAYANATAKRKSLGWTDGTAAGTQFVPSPPLWDYEIVPSKAFGAWGGTNDVVFEAKSTATGNELWLLPATGGVPKLLIDTMPGVDSSLPGPIAEIGGRLIFAAEDPAYGRELFAIDLPQNGAFGAEPFGAGCSKIAAAAVDHSGSGAIGQSLTLEVDGPVPGATALAFLSIGVAATPLGNGCTLYLANPIYLASLPTNASGDAALTGTIPSNPAFVGIGFVTQWFLTEAGGPLAGQYGVSNALDVVIGP